MGTLSVGSKKTSPRIEKVIEYIEKPVEKIIHIEKEIIKEIPTEKIVEKIVHVEKPVIQYVDKIIEVPKEVIREVERIIYKDVEVPVIKETKVIDLSRTFELERQLDSLTKSNKKLKIALCVSILAITVALCLR